jgi:tetratricopeptide (TPR) repeat protein
MRIIPLVVGFALLTTGAGSMFQSTISYAEVVEVYRSGRFAEAVQLLSRPGRGGREVDRHLSNSLQPFQRKRLQVMLALSAEVSIAKGRLPSCVGREQAPEGWPHGMPTRIRKNRVLEVLEDPRFGRQDFEFLTTWYLLVISYDIALGNLTAALACLESAMDTVRSHPEVLLAAGAIHETGWHWENEDGVETLTIAADLRKARQAYSAAAQADPTLLEARLRLARVLSVEGAHEEAAALLQPLSHSADTMTAYIARMLQGKEFQRAGALADAVERYESARSIMPEAQSPRLALAQVAYQQGRRSMAAASVRLTVTPSGIIDPWELYTKGTAWRTDQYLARLRSMILR